MEKQHPLNDLMSVAADKLRALADSNTVVGEPIHAGDVTLIPVSRLSFGIASGGTEYSTKKQAPGEDNAFGGGSGASGKVDPVAFLIVRGDSVKLLPVLPPPATTLDRVIESMPEVVDKITDFIDQQQAKRESKTDLAD